MTPRSFISASVVWVGLLASSVPACAHGFGARYDLPIPLSFYVAGAGAAVALSFVVLAIFLDAEHEPRVHSLCVSFRTPRLRGFALIVRAVSVAAFIALIVAGLFGVQNPFRNIIVPFVWIIGWVGIAFCSALLGDVWRFLNPWDNLFSGAAWLHAWLRPNRRFGLCLAYPQWLGAWPAFVLFVAFAWMELIWSGRDVPARLAEAMLDYSAITWTGMVAFGRDVWRANGEVFSIVFGIFARFAPIAADRNGTVVTLRPPVVGLLQDSTGSLSMVALTIALLATVAFDGFMETPFWARIDAAILAAPADSVLWTVWGLSEGAALALARTAGLVAFVAIFSAIYLLICWITSAATGSAAGIEEIARQFVFTLVPIALAYHVAHYFSYLLIGSQYVVTALSDPLARGWDLFGTAAFKPDVGLVSPRVQWIVAVASVVIGHVIAVSLAHVTALRRFKDRRLALRSQIPIVLLMIGYTMLSLWILSQPIVEVG